jgi:hypothetical protein
MLIKTQCFELEVTRISLYVRINRFEKYWGPFK